MNRSYILPAAISLGVHAAIFLPESERPTLVSTAKAEPVVHYTPVLLPDPPEPEPVGSEQSEEPPVGPALPHIDECVGPTMKPDFPQPAIRYEHGPTDSNAVSIPVGTIIRSAVGDVRKVSIVPRGWLDNSPGVRFRAEPRYPRELQQSGIEGTVVVEFIVEKNGTVSHAQVERSSHPGFEDAALEAVRRWRFEPGVKNNQAVRFRMSQPFVFRLSQ